MARVSGSLDAAAVGHKPMNSTPFSAPSAGSS